MFGRFGKLVWAVALAGLIQACSREARMAESKNAQAPETENAEPSVASPALPAGGSAAPRGETPLVAVNRKPKSEFPMANNSGRFAVQDGCVVLIGAEKVFTPIFSAGPSRIGADGMTFGYGKVLFGTEYVVSGGSVDLPSPDVDLSSEVIARCPKSYYLVVNVDRDPGSAAN